MAIGFYDWTNEVRIHLLSCVSLFFSVGLLLVSKACVARCSAVCVGHGLSPVVGWAHDMLFVQQ